MDHSKIKECATYLIVLVCYLFCGHEAAVKTEYGEAKWFPVCAGIRQESVLFPFLFKLHIEHFIPKDKLDSNEGGAGIDGRNINSPRNADDREHFSDRKEQ